MARGFDLVIKGGRVVDGANNPWVKKDIGIVEGKIRRVGRIAENAGKIIDAKGMIVSPGFVDCHSHSDWSILVHPTGDSKIMQGVTTEVSGLCGYSCEK